MKIIRKLLHDHVRKQIRAGTQYACPIAHDFALRASFFERLDGLSCDAALQRALDGYIPVDAMKRLNSLHGKRIDRRSSYE